MSRLRILCRDSPQRTIALATTDHALVFQHGSTGQDSRYACNNAPRCLVEFSSLSRIDTSSYRLLGYGYGTLGLVTLDEDVFLCVVTGSSQAATVRPGETVSRISNVDFFCLSQAAYEDGLTYEPETPFAADELNRVFGLENREMTTDHPFIALKKLLSDGSFYYSLDFNLTVRIQSRLGKSRVFDVGALDEDMLWNSYMISPLLLFRSHLPSAAERSKLDLSQILTCVIRGFSSTMRIPTFLPSSPQIPTNSPATLTIISRQSSRRAGTRFNSRGIDDHGNVANFVETEVVLWIPSGLTFSYVQLRGSVPIFWEQAPGFLPGQQRIEVTRSTEATQHAFSKHFEFLELEYGSVHVVNLLSEEKPGEAELSLNFRGHMKNDSRKRQGVSHKAESPTRRRLTEYDFHAETRGPRGYDASSQLKQELARSLDMFAYFLGDAASETILESEGAPQRLPAISQQKGIFRTNCLDCLDRTNLVQSIISSAVLESFLHRQGRKLTSDIQRRHSTLWADNGDALSKIYAGTGAIKSSFTRHGKMSLAGALADARKSATRLYVNNFSDKLRQNTIDLLLGRLTNQVPVYLYDPLNDLVSEELKRRASEYTHTKSIRVWTGTFNVNGRNEGLNVDLTPWLFPLLDQQNESPTIFAVAFQEIVPLNPQQIMSTDPTTRKVWENTVSCCLNGHSRLNGTGRYVLLRSSQLVGAALMVYVKEDALSEIRNVEASTKKAGFQGISGNKGGCAIRFEYSNSRICFVTAHLAAGFANYIDRNRDYEAILRGLVFQRNRSIEDHDAVLWLGDFNYRINLDNECTRELVEQRDYQELYDKDQLRHQMAAGAVFQLYSEGPITFPPTYKYDIGTNEYDTSEKARIPAWCDRVLWKGAKLRQTYYSTADLRFSDHRPVWATFDCMISVINETRRSKLRRLLHDENEQKVNKVWNTGIEGEFRESLGVPPASSDHHCWWLDDCAPGRPIMPQSTDGLTVNPYRKSNPFLFVDMEIDWTPLPSSVDTQKDTGSGGKVASRGEIFDIPPHRSMIGDHASGSPKTEEVKSASYAPGGRVDNIGGPPPIPRKLTNLGMVGSRRFTPFIDATGYIDADVVHAPEGNPCEQSNYPHMLPVCIVEDDSGTLSSTKDGSTIRSFGPPQNREMRHSFGVPARGHQKTGNNTGDLLGGGVDEEVRWKPLLQ